jgi:hypothetical protein
MIEWINATSKMTTILFDYLGPDILTVRGINCGLERVHSGILCTSSIISLCGSYHTCYKVY